MSRSVRHAPFCPLGVGGRGITINHQWQRKERRRYRKAVKHAIKLEAEVVPEWKQFCNEWYSPRDGKTWWKWVDLSGNLQIDERSRRK